jgi:hypothetical protein
LTENNDDNDDDDDDDDDKTAASLPTNRRSFHTPALLPYITRT